MNYLKTTLINTTLINTATQKEYTCKISCLSGPEVLSTRSLWEEVFHEDSEAFTSYYFQNKASGNICFTCMLCETREIIGMVHLTPYEIVTRDYGIIPSYYIVGVGTKKEFRHQRIMAALLDCAFDYAKERTCPFVFLMPANPAIYEPFDFQYVYYRETYEPADFLNCSFHSVDISKILCHPFIKKYKVNITPLTFSKLSGNASSVTLHTNGTFQLTSTIAAFANAQLSCQYEYYVNRSDFYYDTLLKELESENGGMFLFSIEEQLTGYLLFAREEEKTYIQEVLFSPQLSSLDGFSNFMSTYFFTCQKEKQPIIMAKNLSANNVLHASAGSTLYANNILHASAGSTLYANKRSEDSLSASPIDYVNYLSTHSGLLNEIV